MLCYSQGSIDDPGFLILSSDPVQTSSSVPVQTSQLRPAQEPISSWTCRMYPLFDLEDVDDDECLTEIRFKKRDIPVEASLRKYQVRIYRDKYANYTRVAKWLASIIEIILTNEVRNI